MTARKRSRVGAARAADVTTDAAAHPGEGIRLRGPSTRIRPAGIGLALRFSVATAIALLSCVTLMTVNVYREVARALDLEIDEAGIQTVRALAVTDVASWGPYFRTPVEGREEEFKDGVPPSVFSSEAERDAFEKQKLLNRARTSTIAPDPTAKLLDAVILDAARQRVINGKGPIKFRPTRADRAVDSVIIQSGVYEGAVTSAARSYAAPLKDRDGAVSGYAMIVLSEAKIEEVLGRMLKKLGMLAALFIALGVAASWVVGRRISRPVSLLVEDMEVVAKGRLDHHTAAHSTDEIGVLARTFDRMTQNLLAARALQAQQAVQQHELNLAREVQAKLFPETLPRISGYECASTPKPTSSIAADFYDILPLGDGSYALAMVSSSGTDIAGSMIVVMARSVLRAVAPGQTSPAEILRKVNHFLAPDLRAGMFVTSLVAILDPARSRVTFANAGHHPLILGQSGERQAAALHSDGIALGFDMGPVFDRTIKDAVVELAVGDRLVLCSPAIFSADERSGELLADEQIYGILGRESSKNSAAFVPLVLAAVARLVPEGGRQREVAFLSVKRMS